MTPTFHDAREPGWFWMEDAIIDRFGPRLGAIGVAIYAYLARRANREGVSFPSYQTIARQLKLSRRTVITYMQMLEEQQLIVACARRSGGGGCAANAYRLVSLRNPDPAAGAAPGASGVTDLPAADAPGGATPAPVQQDHQGSTPGAAALSGDDTHGRAAVVPVQQDHQGGASGAALLPDDETPGGAAVAPVQQDHQVYGLGANSLPGDAHPCGTTLAPVQLDHQGGAADAPGVVQHDHQGGATVAPEGNTEKETHLKETQAKERKDGAPNDCAAASPLDLTLSVTSSGLGVSAADGQEDVLPATAAAQTDQPESGAAAPPASPASSQDAILAALCQVTGKDPDLLRAHKQREYESAAGRLCERGFAAEDVQDFAAYWQQAHPIGSRKPGAGYPHLVQVLEDLPGALPWIRERRARQVEAAAWQEEDPISLPATPPTPPVDAAALALWQRVRDELALRLPYHPAGADLYRARPLRLSGEDMLVELPSARMAEWWQARLRRPLAEAVRCASPQPLTITFTGPQPASLPV